MSARLAPYDEKDLERDIFLAKAEKVLPGITDVFRRLQKPRYLQRGYLVYGPALTRHLEYLADSWLLLRLLRPRTTREKTDK